MPEVIDSGVAYLALKAAQKLYSKAPAALQPEEFERVQSMAQQQHKLEARVLVAPEARDVMVPPSTLEAAMQEIRGRYPSEEEFAGDLLSNGLDEAGFAVWRNQGLRLRARAQQHGHPGVCKQEAGLRRSDRRAGIGTRLRAGEQLSIHHSLEQRSYSWHAR